MFVVTEADEAAIRAVYEQRGEFAAALELRQRFPGITDNAQARACARTIAGWKPLTLRPVSGRRDCGGCANLCFDCGSGGDRPKPSDLSVARTADPIPLSIQGVKRATAPQARTPEDGGGWGRGGCGNVYESADPLQLVVLHFHGV